MVHVCDHVIGMFIEMLIEMLIPMLNLGGKMKPISATIVWTETASFKFQQGDNQ
jgi:hypothetical protein